MATNAGAVMADMPRAGWMLGADGRMMAVTCDGRGKSQTAANANTVVLRQHRATEAMITRVDAASDSNRLGSDQVSRRAVSKMD